MRDSQPLELDFGGDDSPSDQREPAAHDSGTPATVPAMSFAPRESTPRESGPLGTRGSSRRGGRASMPSWDEIVFGARGDDDTSA
jgi:hypothetical protein